VSDEKPGNESTQYNIRGSCKDILFHERATYSRVTIYDTFELKAETLVVRGYERLSLRAVVVATLVGHSKTISGTLTSDKTSNAFSQMQSILHKHILIFRLHPFLHILQPVRSKPHHPKLLPPLFLQTRLRLFDQFFRIFRSI
jgi:hypothetical protein